MRSAFAIAIRYWLQRAVRRWQKFLVFGAISFAIAIFLTNCAQTSAPNQPTIAIGSKNFTEQIVLGEILAQQVEAHTSLAVDRRFNLGGTFICHEAIKAHEIDAYVEYTGTAFTAVLKRDPINDAYAIYQQVKDAYAEQFQLAVLPPLGFSNTFALIVRGKDAREFDLETIADAAPYLENWQAGFGYEFLERKDGFEGLKATYNLTFAKPPKTMDLGLLYRALTDGQVDLIVANSTDGAIANLDLVVLQDNRQYFPPYQAVPVVHQQTLKEYPQLNEVFEQLSSQISEEEMQELNNQVEGSHRDPKQVVKKFLQQKGLIP